MQADLKAVRYRRIEQQVGQGEAGFLEHIRQLHWLFGIQCPAGQGVGCRAEQGCTDRTGGPACACYQPQLLATGHGLQHGGQLGAQRVRKLAASTLKNIGQGGGLSDFQRQGGQALVLSQALFELVFRRLTRHLALVQRS